MKVSSVFLQPLNDWYCTNLTMADFKEETYLDFDVLHPNHDDLDDWVIMKKIMDPTLYTDILVVLLNGIYILINGHHTAVSQFLQGATRLKVKLFIK